MWDKQNHRLYHFRSAIRRKEQQSKISLDILSKFDLWSRQINGQDRYIFGDRTKYNIIRRSLDEQRVWVASVKAAIGRAKKAEACSMRSIRKSFTTWRHSQANMEVT